jgi:hypothetical protein
MSQQISPRQQKTFDELQRNIARFAVVGLDGNDGTMCARCRWHR